MKDVPRDQHELWRLMDDRLHSLGKGSRDVRFPHVHPPRTLPVVRAVAEMQVGEMRD